MVPTYPIVNQSETELGDAINEALGTLKEDGTLSKLSEDVFGYDVFALAEEDETEAETENVPRKRLQQRKLKPQQSKAERKNQRRRQLW